MQIKKQNSLMCKSFCSNMLQIILAWITVSSLVACMPSGNKKPEDAIQTVMPTLTSTPDLVVSISQQNQPVVLEVGQVLKVEPPAPGLEWQVNYDSSLFELLTAPELARAPDAAGWLFRVLMAGEGQIVLTSVVSCSEPPCPLMPMRFQLIVQVR